MSLNFQKTKFQISNHNNTITATVQLYDFYFDVSIKEGI